MISLLTKQYARFAMKIDIILFANADLAIYISYISVKFNYLGKANSVLHDKAIGPADTVSLVQRNNSNRN